MKAANSLETSRNSGDVHLLESAQRQLDALRAAIDARLAELDAALADPSRAASLTGLIVELARLATSEAQAAATRACLQIKSDGEASMLEAEARNLAAVEAERRLASDLRKNLEKTQKKLDLLETEKHAVLQAAREQTQLLEAERASRGDLDRTITRLEQQVADTQAKLVEADVATERATIERTHAQERVAALEQQLAVLGQQLAAAQQQITAEQQAAQTLRQAQGDSAVRAGELDAQLATAERRIADMDQQLTATRATVSALETERVASGDRIAALELDLEAAQATHAGDAASARAAAEQRAQVEARLREQEQRLAEREQEATRLRADLDAAQQAVSQAAATAATDRQAMAATATELATERQARAELLAQLESLTRLLDAERGVTADLRHAISAASSAADGEQQAVETLRQAAADAEQRAADLRLAHAAAQSAADAAAQSLDQERQHAADLQRRLAELERAHGELQQNHDALSQTHTSLSQTHADLERTAAALHSDLDAQRTSSGDADSGLRAELEQTRQDAARARADLAAVQQRLAVLELARAQAEETSVELGERVAVVERERDAFSLALDTERMTTADLRQAATSADRRFADASTQLDQLRQQLATTRPSPAATPAPAADDEEGEVTELTFDEDQVEEPGDGAITLEEEGWESVRLATRYTFTSRIDIKVNGVNGVLCDLSVGGCGVRTTATLETGDTVRVQLPQDPHTLLCHGQVIWVRKEPAAGRTPAGTRAGIRFTQADEGALEAFIIMRADV